MFYKYKTVYFFILYAFCAALYYFINKQLVLTGIMAGFVSGSAVIFTAIFSACFIASLGAALIIKYGYNALVCSILKMPPVEMLMRVSWTIFTILGFAAVFIVFLKAIEY